MLRRTRTSMRTSSSPNSSLAARPTLNSGIDQLGIMGDPPSGTVCLIPQGMSIRTSGRALVSRERTSAGRC